MVTLNLIIQNTSSAYLPPKSLNIVNIPAPNVPQQIAPLQQAPIVAAQLQNHQSRRQRAVNQKPQGFYTGM